MGIGICSTISTTCVADDPYCLEDLTLKFNKQNTQFLSIPNIRVNLVYPSIYAAEWSGDVEDKWVCKASVRVPMVKIKLELVHAYCVLLAMRGLKELFTPSSLNPEAKVAHKPTESNPPAVLTREKIIRLQALANTLELLFSMPKGQAIAARVNGLDLQVTPTREILVSWPSCFFWVPRLKGLSERLERPIDNHQWEEFISSAVECLHFVYSVQIPPGHMVSLQGAIDFDTTYALLRAVKFIQDQEVQKSTVKVLRPGQYESAFRRESQQ